MRTLVVAVGVSLAGCAKPQPVEVPAVAIAPEVAVPAIKIAPPPRLANPFLMSQQEMDSYRNARQPLLRALGRGEIKAGDGISSVIERFPMYEAVSHDPYITVRYSTGLTGGSVAAKDGKVVEAEVWSCDIWGEQFFNTLTRAEWADYQRSRTAVQEARSAFGKALPAVTGVPTALGAWWRRLLPE